MSKKKDVDLTVMLIEAIYKFYKMNLDIKLRKQGELLKELEKVEKKLKKELKMNAEELLKKGMKVPEKI